MRKNALVPTDEECEYGDWLHDERRERRAEEQAELFAKPLEPDTFTLLRLFENERGIDIGRNWLDLLQVYHSVFDEPDKRPKTSWRPERLRRALDQAEALGLITDGRFEWGRDWMITARGLEARKAETVRRMRE